jgi:hypothetical protein
MIRWRFKQDLLFYRFCFILLHRNLILVFFKKGVAMFAWKEYYAAERLSRHDQIITIAKKHWQQSEVPKNITDVIQSGGILSFPHTFLDDSMMPLMHSIGAIYKAKRSKVLAIGVLHGKKEQEFSLDGLVYVAKLYAEANNLMPLSFTEIYRQISVKDIAQRDRDIRLLIRKGGSLKNELDSDTAVVMTGDLVHYGYGYGDQSPQQLDSLPDILQSRITELLGVIYHKRDSLLFIEKSLAVKNDQIAPAIIVNALFNSPLDYSIFSFMLSDYSPILKSASPTVVASVHYGVYPQ